MKISKLASRGMFVRPEEVIFGASDHYRSPENCNLKSQLTNRLVTQKFDVQIPSIVICFSRYRQKKENGPNYLSLNSTLFQNKFLTGKILIQLILTLNFLPKIIYLGMNKNHAQVFVTSINGSVECGECKCVCLQPLQLAVSPSLLQQRLDEQLSEQQLRH